MKIDSSEITWYEDGNFLEWWLNDSIKPQDKRFKRNVTLMEAIEIAKQNNIVLCIQPAMQDECIILDYTEENIWTLNH